MAKTLFVLATARILGNVKGDEMTAIVKTIVLTCPPKTEPVLVLDWRLKKKGVVNGQEGVQTRADHQQAA